MSYEAVQWMLIKMKKTARFKLLTALFVIFSILLTSILSYLAWLKFISFSSMMATSVLLIIINAALLIWWQRSNTPSDTSKKEVLANVARELITLLNLLERKEKLINKNLLAVPRQLFIGHHLSGSTAMHDLGYSQHGDVLQYANLHVSVWSSGTSLAYRVDVKHSANTEGEGEGEVEVEVEVEVEISDELLSLLLDQLSFQRPQLALNGIFVELNLSAVVRKLEAATSYEIIVSRMINKANFKLGLDLPIHILLLGLERIPDLSRAIFLAQKLGAKSGFGGFLELGNEDSESTVTNLFKEMISNLESVQFQALRNQLSQEFCVSIINAPMQLACLYQPLDQSLRLLTNPTPPRKQPLSLRSLVFIGACQTGPVIDPLLLACDQQLFFSEAELLDRSDLSSNVINNQTHEYASAYDKQSFSLKANQKYKVRRRWNKLLVNLSLISLAALTLIGSWQNYQHFDGINKSVKSAFEQYYSEAKQLSKGADGLPERVMLLKQLKGTFEEYSVEYASRLHHWLPTWSQETTFVNQFELELLHGFQPALIEYLAKDLSAYNALGWGADLVRLSAIERAFHTDQEKNKATLIHYFTTSLAEQGQVLQEFQSAFSGLLDDLFRLNQPPVDKNVKLQQVIAKTIKNLPASEILYQALVNQPKYTERLDLGALLGPRFAQVFDIDTESANYLIPLVYTREGFDDIYKNGELFGIDGLINDYEKVTGPLTESRKNTIIRQISQQYAQDYIGVWTSFISSLSLREFEGDAELLALIEDLAAPENNPLKKLVNITRTHLVLGTKDAAPKSLESSDSQSKQPTKIPSFEQKNLVAANINGAFSFWAIAFPANDTNDGHFDLLVKEIRALNQWIDMAANDAGGAGAYLVTQWNNNGLNNPISKLTTFANNASIMIIRDIAKKVSLAANSYSMNQVYGQINRLWQRELEAQYADLIATSYPFDPSSSKDLSAIDFARIYGPGGAIEQFKLAHLSKFISASGVSSYVNTFTSERQVGLSESTTLKFSQYARIASALFSQGQPNLKFQIRTIDLDSQYSQLRINAGKTLYRFSHGPVIWQEQSWPGASQTQTGLALYLSRHNRILIRQSLDGFWAWFRLLNEKVHQLDLDNGLLESQKHIGGSNLVLQVTTPNIVNPFGASYFSSALLPHRLFETQ
tara:strand:- start:2778 stop:6251 length:3474 start_codon:yes stop_codon:yes gene_type:complete